MTTTGPHNSITDVPGIRVGHSTRREPGWLTGTTVVVAPDAGAVGGVDVRGGGPGTRETDLLDPRNLVEAVHAVVLSGGSAFGLAATDGVMQRLYTAGVGFAMGEPGQVVPIVPAAVIFDLGRGGDFSHHPDAAMGAAAFDAAESGPAALGVCGAGTGAKAGDLKGGVGSASAVLADGCMVGALVVANPVGSPFDPETGELYAARYGLGEEFGWLTRPDPAELRAVAADAAAREAAGPPLATTIGVVATDATLTKAQAARVAGQAHDGLARAIRPVHTMFDGDTIFTLATGDRPAPDATAFHDLLVAAADCVTRAVGHAVLAAETVVLPTGPLRGYRDAFASAVTVDGPR